MRMIQRCRILAIGLFCTAAILSAGPQSAAAQARIGNPAPGFTLTDSNGRAVSLADFKGKTVVLEWTNHECPYVGKHYRGNNMQALQKKWTGQGVVWLSVISSAPGEDGHVTPQQANQELPITRCKLPSWQRMPMLHVSFLSYRCRSNTCRTQIFWPGSRRS